MFGFCGGAGGRGFRGHRFTAAVFVYFAQRVYKLFTFRFGCDRRRRRRRRGRIHRRTGFCGSRLSERRRGWPDGRQQFLRSGVKLFGRILRRLWRNGPPEELFLLFEALFYPGHDNRIVRRRRRLTVMMVVMQPVLIMVVMGGMVGRHLLQQAVAARHADVHAVPTVRMGRRCRGFAPVMRVAATTVGLGARGRPSGAGRPVRRHESGCGWRLYGTASAATGSAVVFPDALIDRAGIATTMETQFAARCHSRF